VARLLVRVCADCLNQEARGIREMQMQTRHSGCVLSLIHDGTIGTSRSRGVADALVLASSSVRPVLSDRVPAAVPIFLPPM